MLLCVAVGCQSIVPEGIEKPLEEAEVMKVFTADHSEGAQTRTVVGEDNLVYWDLADSINVFDVNENPRQNAIFRIVSKTSASEAAVKSDDNVPVDTIKTVYYTSADFTGYIPACERGYFAVYPYRDYSDYDPDTIYGLFDQYGDDGIPESLRLNWAGRNQCPQVNSFDRDKIIMVARTGSDTLHFKNVFAFVKFTTEFPCDEIIISSNGSESLTAQDIVVEVNPRDGEWIPSITSYSKTAASDGNAVVRDSLGRVAPGTYLVAVMPQTLSQGLTITFSNPNGLGSFYTPSKTTSKSVTLTRSRALNLGTFGADFLDTTIEGHGTESSPYEVQHIGHLSYIASRVNNGVDGFATAHYKLMNDIDCDGRTLTPIGASENRPFQGTFDGQSFTISNYVPGCQNHSSALFGYVKSPAVIKDLAVKPLKINEDFNTDKFHAYSALVGVTCTDNKDAVVTLSGCSVSNSGNDFKLNLGNYDIYFGSMIGLAESGVRLTGCRNGLRMYVDTYGKYDEGNGVYSVGGMIGAVTKFSKEVHCTLDKCWNTGIVQVQNYGDSYVGGLIGRLHDSGDVIPEIASCTNNAEVTVNNDRYSQWVRNYTYAGGIVGYMDADGYHDEDPYILNCYNTGPIYGWAYGSCRLGGIMGNCYDDDTHIINCASAARYIRALYSDKAYMGALCGSKDGNYLNCHWKSVDLPMVYGSSDEDYKYREGCSCVETLTSDMMNEKLSSIPDRWGLTYCSWVGSGSTLSLGY